MTNIYAFDLSLRSSGIAYLVDDTMALRTTKTDRKKLDLQEAVRVQAAVAVQVFTAGKPDVVIMESGALGAIRGQGYEELGALRWLIKDHMRHYFDMEVVQITPSHLKKTVTGNGRASKEEVWESVKLDCLARDWPEPRNNDEADAIALILTYEVDNARS